MILSALIADFLEYLEVERNASQLTIRNYNHCLKRFLQFARLAKRVGEIEPKDIDLPTVRKYRLYLARFQDPKRGKPLKKVTQNLSLIALRRFLNYLAQNDILTLSPKDVELRAWDSRPLKVLDDTEQSLILEQPDRSKKDGIRDRAILETLFSTGLRVSELTSLNRDDIGGMEFEILGKRGIKRAVVLSENAYSWINKYLLIRKDSFKPLFIRFQGKVSLQANGEAMRLTSRSVQRIVEKYVKRLGLVIKATPQTLRHSFAANTKRNGADIQTLQEMLGLLSNTSIKAYANLANK